MIALFVTQVIDSSTYWPKLGIGYWALSMAYSPLLAIPHSSDKAD
ncbi:hypothetical protein [Nostoc sp. 'Lobaria pulmonaria (5183) cyanobiont']|nr:hypothetical protein [Nostoc sp. 'Lobaria pulmonaria (5183) cyanobiont']